MAHALQKCCGTVDDSEAVIELLVDVMDSVERQEPVDFESVRAQLVFHSDQMRANPADEAGGRARLSEFINLCGPIVDLLETGDVEHARGALRKALRRWGGHSE